MLTSSQRGLAWGLLIAAVASAHPATRADEPDRAKLEAEAAGQAAEADRLFKAGEFAAALPLYQAERTSRAALGDFRYQAYAERAIGCCRQRLGDIDGAIEAWRAAIALDARRRDRGFEGYDWFLIGQVQLGAGQVGEAVANLNRSLPLLSQAVDRDHEADARLLLARALLDQGDASGAHAHLERSLALARALGDPQRVAAALSDLARVEVLLGKPGSAAEWLAEARSIYVDLQDDAEAAAVDRLLGNALVDLGRPEVARARVEQAAAAHARLNDALAVGDDHQFLAQLCVAGNDLPAALDHARRAVAALHDADDPAREIEALVGLSRCESLSGDWAGSAQTLARALPLVRRFGEAAEKVRLLILAADVQRRARPGETGAALLDEAQRIARTSGDPALARAVDDARQREPRR